MWVYFLKQKYEIFVEYKEFEALVENESGHQIKVLRYDHGGEYDSNAFNAYYKQHGIKRKFTTRYTLQHNGVAKRKKKTIMSMARSMLIRRKLTNEYQAEEFACVVYVITYFLQRT